MLLGLDTLLIKQTNKIKSTYIITNWKYKKKKYRSHLEIRFIPRRILPISRFSGSNFLFYYDLLHQPDYLVTSPLGALCHFICLGWKKLSFQSWEVAKAAAYGSVRCHHPNRAEGHRSDRSHWSIRLIGKVQCWNQQWLFAVVARPLPLPVLSARFAPRPVWAFWSDANNGLEMSISNLTVTVNIKWAKVVHVELDS